MNRFWRLGVREDDRWRWRLGVADSRGPVTGGGADSDFRGQLVLSVLGGRERESYILESFEILSGVFSAVRSK
nr:hypothetical protein Iba_chr06eCG10590 [Ipomoea batatas]